MIETPSGAITTFDRITKLIGVVIWPLVLVTGIVLYRHSIDKVIKALVALAEGADEMKLWQLEIKRKVKEVAVAASNEELSETVSSIPEAQKTAATEIKAIVSSARSVQKRMLLRQSVKVRMTALALEYERVRRNMSSGKERTSAMNGVTAEMRALGLAARPFRSEFSSSKSPGLRLAAIAILQVSPSSEYLGWLFERFSVEQPFIFYQASLAILQAVRKYGPRRPTALNAQLRRAIKHVESFQGGTPDANTLQVLRDAVLELQRMHPDRTRQR